MEAAKENLNLNFHLQDLLNNQFNITLIFSNNLNIICQNENSFPIKI